MTKLEADIWQQLLPEVGDGRIGLGVRKNSLWSFVRPCVFIVRLWGWKNAGGVRSFISAINSESIDNLTTFNHSPICKPFKLIFT